MKKNLLYFENHFKSLITFTMFFSIIAVSIILLTSSPNSTPVKNEPLGLNFTNGWTVIVDDNLMGIGLKLPIKSSNTDYHTIDAYNIFPHTGYKCSVLSTMVYQREFQVFIEDKLIYEWTFNDDASQKDTIGSRLVFVTIPKECEGKPIHLRFTRTVTGDDASILPVEIYNAMSNYTVQIGKNNSIMIVITASLLVAIIALLFSLFIYQKDFFYSPYTYLVLHILTLSLWSLCNGKYMQFFTDNALLIHNIEYICFYSTVLFMWLYIYLNWKICPKIILSQIIILALFFVLSLIFKLFGICDFFAILKIYHTMLFFTLPVLIYTLIAVCKCKIESLKVFYIGFIGLAFIGGIEILRFYFAITEMERLKSFLIGMIIMISCVFLSFALSIREQLRSKIENEMYKKLANTDRLTTISNRLAFDTALQRFGQRTTQYKTITLAFIDVNDFKNINDTFGHSMGDTVLQKIAVELNNQFSEFATCYRIGGDEFCVLATDCDENIVAEHLNILNYNLSKGIGELNISVSFGLSTCDKNDINSLYDSFNLADTRMYEQKLKYKEQKSNKVNV